jgi:hypothetical protein
MPRNMSNSGMVNQNGNENGGIKIDEKTTVFSKGYKGTAPFAYDSDNPDGGSGGGGGKGMKGAGGIMQYIIMAGISLLVVLAFGTFISPAPKLSTYKSDITRLESDLVAMRKTESDLSVKLDSMQSILNGIKTNIDSLDNKYASKAELSSINTQLNSLKTSINPEELAAAYDKISTIDDMNASLQIIMDNFEELTEVIGRLQDRITYIEEHGSGGSGTGTGTGTIAGLNAVVIPNAFTGTTYITTVSSNVSQTYNFSVKLSNTTGKQANGIQMAVALQMNKPFIIQAGFPSGFNNVNYTLFVNNSSSTWTQQSTGDWGILGFMNGVSTGVFSSIGNINQGVGDAVYNFTLTIDPNGQTLPAFLLYPIVQVTSYTAPS